MSGANERDQSVERLLRQALKTPRDTGEADTCVDAETVAAWLDGGLSDGELAEAQAHVVGCARCQMLLAAMARTGETADLTSSANALPAAERPWWVMWVMPLAAAAAVALYIAVPQRPSTPAAPSADAFTAVAPTGDALNARPTGEPAGPRRSEPALRKDAEAERREPSLTPPPPALREGPATAAPPTMAKAERHAEADRLNRTATSVQQAPADAEGLAAAPASPAAASSLSDRAVAPPSAVAQAPTAAAATSATAARSDARLRETFQAANGAIPIASTEFASPDPRIRWRIVGSRIERSLDAGADWMPLSVDNATPLTAGVAPSPSVCWVVGRAGVVLRSTDGRSWERVMFPEITDLSAVRAIDARTASISTADGRTFRTTDGGATWSR